MGADGELRILVPLEIRSTRGEFHSSVDQSLCIGLGQLMGAMAP